MAPQVFLVTPPFTQLNTPYPATAYLKGFFNTKGITADQADLGIEVILKMFSKKGLIRIFDAVVAPAEGFSENAKRILALKNKYIETIDSVVRFLQHHDPTLAQNICRRGFLPEAARFSQAEELSWAFGAMGNQDKARHLATLYLEDVNDLIVECVDPHFGFSRYAEKLGRYANTFDELHHSLLAPESLIDTMLFEVLEAKIGKESPQLVAVSVPFPGNLFAGFRIAQWFKKHHQQTRLALGGGFPNTELRSLNDVRVFEYFNFVTLDDGERPLEQLINFINGKCSINELKRTFLLQDSKVCYINYAACNDYQQSEVGTPDYAGLPIKDYLSVIEVTNPMHSLWSDGRWNKLTMAHGCYWGKCTFCDVSLDYIKVYEPIAASLIVDKMEQLIAETGETGFHFVDEAAPPALMKAVAIEIIRRRLVVSWWTNIRFEKSFTRDLCFLLRASGCIAVSGGLEVASDRLLELIQKGITVAQVAQVNKHFREAGIMVHAYLMYGFPSQTAQETIDSMEMVRQMFNAGILQSGFWHRFALTVHSPVGLAPEKFGIKITSGPHGPFANNDLDYIDPSGADPSIFSDGLKKSLFNYMHGVGLDAPLQKWFEEKVPRTKIAPDFIQKILEQGEIISFNANQRVVFCGELPRLEIVTKSKKGASWEVASLKFQTTTETLDIRVDKDKGIWLHATLNHCHISNPKPTLFKDIQADYETNGWDDFELFWDNKPVYLLYKAGLFVL